MFRNIVLRMAWEEELKCSACLLTTLLLFLLPARMVSIVAVAASYHARRIRADLGAKATAEEDLVMDRQATGPATQSSGTLLTSCHNIRLRAIVFLFHLTP